MLHGLGPVHISAHTVVMDGSRVAQSLDSLWFYTNVFACSDDPVVPLIDQFATSIHAQESPERDLQKPFTPFRVNLQDEPRNGETLTPECHIFGGLSSAPSRERKKRERRERRKWNKLGSNVVDGRVDWWFDKLEEESCKHQAVLDIQQQQTKMPPFDDAEAMKEHLKSWAYAVVASALSDESTLVVFVGVRQKRNLFRSVGFHTADDTTTRVNDFGPNFELHNINSECGGGSNPTTNATYSETFFT
ncbi:unnamed protein product [Sphenostylis stenocarpa]|uniref:Uncharacterized protein n=1 Tax=Sphenostylis stenocarpa TaxID=92480 RepID=A0AA86S1V7_9FABA|nr:unnamed protein product [Sphenostylis stenocarpa]